MPERLHGHGHPPARWAALDPGRRVHRPLLCRVRPRPEPGGLGRGCQAIAGSPPAGRVPRRVEEEEEAAPLPSRPPRHTHTLTLALALAAQLSGGHPARRACCSVLWFSPPWFRKSCLLVCLSVCWRGGPGAEPVGGSGAQGPFSNLEDPARWAAVHPRTPTPRVVPSPACALGAWPPSTAQRQAALSVPTPCSLGPGALHCGPHPSALDPARKGPAEA